MHHGLLHDITNLSLALPQDQAIKFIEEQQLSLHEADLQEEKSQWSSRVKEHSCPKQPAYGSVESTQHTNSRLHLISMVNAEKKMHATQARLHILMACLNNLTPLSPAVGDPDEALDVGRQVVAVDSFCLPQDDSTPARWKSHFSGESGSFCENIR